MRRRWLPVAWLAVVIGTSLAGAASSPAAASSGPTARGSTPAAAAGTAPGDGPTGATLIQASFRPTRADQAADRSVCEIAAGPYPGVDVWAFATVSGRHLDTVTAAFTDASGTAEVRQLAPGDQAVDLAGHSVAWLRTPAGWALKAATATVGAAAEPDPTTGPSIPPGPATTSGPPASASPPDPGTGRTTPDDGLRLAGACPAAAAGLGLLKDSPAAVTVPSAQSTPDSAGTDQTTVEAQQAPVTTLPLTGDDLGSMLAVGFSLVIAGTLLLTVRRRRHIPKHAAARTDDRLVWTMPPQ